MQAARKKEYRAKPEDLENIAKTQEVAVDLTKKYLFGPVKEMRAAGYSRLEMACAFIMFGYHLLRQGQPEEKAKDAFNVLTYFAGRRIERGIADRRKKKLSKLH